MPNHTVPVLLATLALTASANAATLGITAGFQDNTTGGWTAGPPHPQPPSVVEDTGPAGPGDHHLAVFASGSAGRGGRLATFNEDPDWTGSYTGAGITALSGIFRNIGGGTLHVRVALDGPGGRYSTAAALVLPTPSLWTPHTFALDPAALVHVPGTGTGNPADTLAAVSQLRLIHNPSPAFKAIPSPGALAADDITLIPEPSTATLLALTLILTAAILNRRRELW